MRYCHHSLANLTDFGRGGRREGREQENLENKDEFWGFLLELGGPIVGLTTFQKKLIHM